MSNAAVWRFLEKIQVSNLSYLLSYNRLFITRRIGLRLKQDIFCDIQFHLLYWLIQLQFVLSQFAHILWSNLMCVLIIIYIRQLQNLLRILWSIWYDDYQCKWLWHLKVRSLIYEGGSKLKNGFVLIKFHLLKIGLQNLFTEFRNLDLFRGYKLSNFGPLAG